MIGPTSTSSRRSPQPTPARVLALGLPLILASCVTESPRPPRAARTTGQSQEQSPARLTLPSGPIATPAGKRTTARLSGRIVPLGVVPYDGQVLPLISPDGLFMAVEQGDAPTWPTLLARPDAVPSPGTRLAAYDLKQPLREIAPLEPPPRGCILGRSADARGYLVEWPRPDGSRWIGRVPWVSGKVEWLAQGADVNAHGALASDGTLAFTRRANAPRSPVELVVRHPDGIVVTFTPAEGDCAFPVFAPGSRVVCTLVLSPAGIEIVALRTRHADGEPVRSFGPPLARRTIGPEGDLTLAYQAMAGASATLADRPTEPAGADEAVLLFHPGAGRTAAFWWRDGSLLLLADKSIAAAHSALVEPPGFFQTSPDGLMFSPMPADLSEGSVPARVMDATYVPRATSNPERPLMLIGPASRRDPLRLSVIAFGGLEPGEE